MYEIKNLDHLAYHQQDCQLHRSPSVVQHVTICSEHRLDPNSIQPYNQTVNKFDFKIKFNYLYAKNQKEK